jgi:hypothetical protein
MKKREEEMKWLIRVRGLKEKDVRKEKILHEYINK